MKNNGWKQIAPAPAVSPAKLAANQANAQLSTGPRTEAGKARSARNSSTHGLTARELVVRPDEQDEFAAFLAGFRDDFAPEGALEETLFAQIVHAAWNLRRLRILEAELFAQTGIDPLADEQNEAKLDRFARYAQRFERAFHRAIKELRLVQTARSQRASILPAVRETIPPRADTAAAVLAKRTHPALAREDDSELLLASLQRETDILQSHAHAAGAGRL